MISDIQGWFDFHDIYSRMVAQCRPGGTIIELGVWKGLSLCFLAQKAKEADKNLRVIGIDNWRHGDWDGYFNIRMKDFEQGEKRSVLEQCQDNLEARGLLDFVELMEGDSIKAADHFADGSVDFIFVDDTHSNAHVWAELFAWIPKLRRPTWIAGHDYPGIIAEAVRAHFPLARQEGNSWVADLP